MTSEKQRKIEQTFLNKYYSRTQEFPVWHVKALARTIFAEKPDISEKGFEKEIVARIPTLRQLTKSLEKTLRDFKRMNELERLAWPANFFYYASNSLKVPFKELIRSFKLNMKFIPTWLKAKPKKIGNFTLHHVIWPHPEAMLAMEIRRPEGERLGTIGGYLYYDGKQPTIRITNVQGKGLFRMSETYDKFTAKKKRMLEQYSTLSSRLGENWRTHFVKEAISLAKKKSIPLVVEIPSPDEALEPRRRKRQHRRQTRLYQQTFRKAGLKEQPDKTWRFTPKKRLRK